MTNKSRIPTEWLTQMTESRPELPHNVGEETLSNLAPILTKIGSRDVKGIRAGVIYAHGDADMDDTESELHHRYQRPITSSAGYSALNTGTLISAPRIAALLTEMTP